MPYKSQAQRRLMQAVEHSPEFSAKVGIPQSVGRKFAEHRARGGLAYLAEGGLPLGAMPTMAAGVPKGALNLFSNLMEYVRQLKVNKPLPAEGWEQLLKAPEYKLEGVKFPISPDEHQFFGTQDILAKLRQEGQPLDKAGMLGRLEAGQPKLSTQQLPQNRRTLTGFTTDFAEYSSPQYRLPGEVGDYRESLTHYQPRLRDVDPAADPDLPYAQLEDYISTQGLPADTANQVRSYVRGETSEHGLSWHSDDLHDVEQLKNNLANFSTSPTYKPAAGHFGSNNENLLSHSRATRRTTTDGQPIRVIEEIQSDWHQQARDKGGYRTQTELTVAEMAEKQQLEAKLEEFNKSLDTLSREDHAKRNDALSRLYELIQKAPLDESKPPIAPFKKNYGTIELKKQLAEAIDSGDQYLAWTTGEQQRDRYADALKKQVDSIGWSKDKNGTYSISPLKGDRTVGAQSGVKDGDLDALIGKDMANQIRTGGESGLIQGDNLTVGGQGMRQFYDKDLRQQAEKLVRQYGGDPATDIQMVKVPGAETMPRELSSKIETFAQELSTLHPESRRWSGLSERIMDDAMDRFDPEAQNALEGPIVDAIVYMGNADEERDLPKFIKAFKEYRQRVNEFYATNSVSSEVPAIRITDKMRETYNKLKAKTGSGFSRYAVPPLMLGPMATELLQQDQAPWQ